MVAHKRTFCEQLSCLCRNYVRHLRETCASQELERLDTLRADLSLHQGREYFKDDLIQQVHEHDCALHGRQVEHQARQYWQHAYPHEHPSDIINGDCVSEPVYIAKERKNAALYGFNEPKPSPLHD